MKPSIEIPVNPAVKKYLEIKLGKEYHLSTDDWFGIMIYNFLIYKSNKNFKITPKRISDNPSFFTVFISENQAEKNGISLTEKQEISINNMVEKIFREEMYNLAILNKTLCEIEYRVSINYFLDSFDITEDDLSFDTIIKDFDRKKFTMMEKLYL